MKDPRQFGGNKPAAGAAGAGGKETFAAFDCSAVELWLADWADGTLPAGVAERIDAHAAGCAACREKLAQARRGREWLLVLKQERLEPPVGLVAKILARTSLAGMADAKAAVSGRAVLDGQGGAEAVRDGHAGRGLGLLKKAAEGKTGRGSGESSYIHSEDSAAASVPAWQQSSVVVLRRTFVEPRLILVAAMAFFSIAVTMNLLGVRPTRLHAADLAPKNMHRAMTRQYAEVNARVVRYYENLRIVYEVEAQVQQLRRAAETPAPQTPSKPRKQSSDTHGDSSDGLEGSRQGSRQGPLAGDSLPGDKQAIPAAPDPRPIVTGPKVDASMEWPGRFSRHPAIYGIAKAYPSASLRFVRDDRNKSDSRFPAGMTERKTKAGLSASLGFVRDDRKKGDSRFPAGMTERKTKAGFSASLGFVGDDGNRSDSRFPAGMTERKTKAGSSASLGFVRDDGNKSGSRFPAGMTERKTKAGFSASLGFVRDVRNRSDSRFPAGMTKRKTKAGSSASLRLGRQAIYNSTSTDCFSMRYFSTRERRLA